MQVGQPVKVVTGAAKGDVGTIERILEDGTVMVKFGDFSRPQPYFKWELSQNGVFPPRQSPE